MTSSFKVESGWVKAFTSHAFDWLEHFFDHLQIRNKDKFFYKKLDGDESTKMEMFFWIVLTPTTKKLVNYIIEYTKEEIGTNVIYLFDSGIQYKNLDDLKQKIFEID